MVDAPWRTDRPLDESMVREIVRDQFPGVRAGAIRAIGDGWDFDVYDIDRRWVFRFPKRREYDARFATELALLDEIAGCLPLPVPHYEFRGAPSPQFPYHFGGYAMLPGQPLTAIEPSTAAVETAAAQLGGFLDELHRCGGPRIDRLDLYGEEDYGTTASQREETLECLDKLEGAIDPSIHGQARALLTDDSQPPADYDGPRRLSHGDLLPGHILADPSSGAITGIIDWSDAARADPMGDFVGLWMWAGDAAVAEALSEYHLPIDAQMPSRIRHRGLCVLLDELHYARLRGYDRHAAFCECRLHRELSHR